LQEKVPVFDEEKLNPLPTLKPVESKQEKKLRKPSKFKKLKKNIQRNWQLYVMLSPILIFFIIFHYIPMYGVQIAFKDFYANLGITGSPWVGFEHFERFFSSFYFWRLLENTVVLGLYHLLLFPLPIIFALALNELKDGIYKKLSQTLTYAPHFISTVVVVGMLVAFLDPVTGLVNNVITAFGGEPISFLTSPEWFRHVYVWSGEWQTLGWGAIIYLAALSGVNPELHEAATIDGASRLQRIIHINIPSILPVIVVMFILEIGNFMSVGFEKVLLMQNSLNAETSNIIQTFVYDTGLLQGQYSYGAAVGLFDSVINIILLVSANWIARKVSNNSLW
jgi:putative aldouronate transport system permease protein